MFLSNTPPKIVIRLKLCTVVVLYFCLFWLGCGTKQLQNITGSTPVTAYSVIQGLVTGSSILPSRSKVVSYNVSQVASESMSFSETESFIFGSESAKRIMLITEDGLILEDSVFDQYTNDGKLQYRFAGEFPKESLRLRIIDADVVYEVAVGSLSPEDEVVKIPDFDIMEAALATRMLEQTSEYKYLKNKKIGSFFESIHSVIEKRIRTHENKQLLVKNIERLGINSVGDFEIYPTNYRPYQHRNPSNPHKWEKDLFSTATESIKKASEETSQIEKPKNRPISKQLVNWITHVNLVDKDIETNLFNYSNKQVNSTNIFSRQATIKIYFTDSLSKEFRDSLIDFAQLKLELVGSRRYLFLRDLNPDFINDSTLKLDINLSMNKEQKTTLFLHHTFPELRPDEVSQAFMKINLIFYN